MGQVASQPGAAAGIMDQLQGWFAKNPRLAKSLMAGLGTAAVGGGLTAMSKRENETPGERRKRILRNALLAGGAGAGAVGLGDYALGQLKTVDPEPVDPVLGPSRNIAAGAGAVGGLGVARQMGKVQQTGARGDIVRGIGEELERKEQKSVPKGRNQTAGPELTPGEKGLKATAKGSGGDSKGLRGLFGGANSPDALFNRMVHQEGAHPGNPSVFEETARRAGVGDAKKFRTAGYIDPKLGPWAKIKAMVAREGRKTFGHTAGSRLGRTGIIAGSAAVPYALVSTLMNNPELADNTLGQYRKLDKPGVLDSLK